MYKVATVIYGVVYGPTIWFAKLAHFLLYLRIFSCSRTTKIAIYLGIIVSFIFHIALAIFVGVGCVPRPGSSWLATPRTNSCKSVGVLYYVQGIFGVLSDLYIFVLPIPIFCKTTPTCAEKARGMRHLSNRVNVRSTTCSTCPHNLSCLISGRY